ncbi:MAG: hypothetical protein ILA30_04450 [Selenomonas sp.]|nr:hypothetical protein [Selenomonas sp.]
MDNKKFANSKLNDQELEGVAGGTYLQSMEVAMVMDKAGYKNMLNDIGGVNFDNMRTALKDMGFESHDKGGLIKDNTYTQISTGKELSQAELMKILKQKFPGVNSGSDRNCIL